MSKSKHMIGRIYKIHCYKDDNSDVYIGSTTKHLTSRWCQHKFNYLKGNHYVSSARIFDKYGIENSYISILQEVECSDKSELRKFEQSWIDNTLNCVNKHRAHCGDKSHYDKYKKTIYAWRDKNKEQYRDYLRDYFVNKYANDEKFSEKMKAKSRKAYQKRKLFIDEFKRLSSICIS